MAPSAWYRAALLCGAGPLLAGLTIFGLWVATRWDGWMYIGAANVALGVILFCAGLFTLSRYSRLARLEAAIPLKRISFQVAVATGLLFANIPAACTIVLKAVEIHSRYDVTISNRSDRPIDSCVLAGGGVHVELGPVRPGESRKTAFWIRQDGELVLKARQGEREIDAVIESYVTHGQGGRRSVAIGPGGALHVEEEIP